MEDDQITHRKDDNLHVGWGIHCDGRSMPKTVATEFLAGIFNMGMVDIFRIA